MEQFILTAALAVAVYILCLLGYRLTLHPLTKFPGPLIAKLTDGFGGFYALRKDIHLKVYEDHMKYGHVVRYGPDRLIFNTESAFQTIYNSDRVTKSHVYRAAQQHADQFNIFNVRDRGMHRAKRRLIGQVVSEKSMRSFEPVMLQQIDVLLLKLMRASASSAPVNITPTVRQLGIDIVGHLGFGYDLKMQTEETNHWLMNAFYLGDWRINVCMQWPLLTWIRPEVISGLMPNSIRARLFNLLDTMIKARLSQKIDSKHDLLGVIAGSMGDEFKSLRQQELWTEALFFFPAGGETTATAISAAFFYLSRNRECYNKLKEEIRSSFASGSEIRQGPQLANCRYLRAVIDESLRMCPSVPGVLWRELVSCDDGTQPFIVDGHVIPKGTQFGVHIFSLHHNEDIFPMPFRFRPERWLEAKDEEARKAMDRGFAAFSTGSRGCAGKPMGYLECSLVLAKTLWYFDFEKASALGGGVTGLPGIRGRTSHFQVDDTFAATHDGPHIKFVPRPEVIHELN
ncbi:unnamed protein product [Clonostachys rhizophaga]|uniref:Cytochrome P450 n=1 Tax=Clonostachys rhizophaga TaxID=160324 RepID=A0A9N9VLP4_9HYPO|nr:unnamed protein product [Clonostachys rhizophaga]